jgi:hypothetical protein
VLLLPDAQLEERRRAVAGAGPLAPLFDSLDVELEPLLGREMMIPNAKALLSRAGGRCAADGSVLEFDPWSPQQHRCETCGAVYTGELHHRAWVMSYQLWLAERAVHGALLHLLRGDAPHATLARDIIRAYAERYERYPNEDNVLGPTRLFFSTYLESIWLLQIAVAADLLEQSGDRATADIARERIIVPSSAIVAEFDEGMSNRQVWNNAALLASASLLRDSDAFDQRVSGPSGVRAHLSRALLADATWYEGENYHQFALRGLWYCVTLSENAGCDIGAGLRDRFQRAFLAPYVTALPDFTMPSRKDSQYAVSLRQWRMAEVAELGFARHQHPVLAGALRRTYEPGHERRDTGRSRSTADVERNRPPSALSRADLGWRALLHAVPQLPALPDVTPRSALLEDQGYAVFRREGDVYVGFEFGQSGGGHGHPDRLNLTMYQGGNRWLDDMGTGSYVDPSLHWFRSTLSHNAPLVDGQSQPLKDGRLIAYDEREGLGWIVAEFLIPEKGVRLERAVLIAPDYLIDELRWTADKEVRVELPWHFDSAFFDHDAMKPTEFDGSADPEDGFAFVREARATTALGHMRLTGLEDAADLTLFTAERTTLFQALAPGQPPGTERRFFVLRSIGRSGTLSAVLSWNRSVTLEPSAVHTSGERVLALSCGSRERQDHRRDASGWHVTLHAGSARSSIDLAGFRPTQSAQSHDTEQAQAPTTISRGPVPDGWLSDLPAAQLKTLRIYELGENHYRRSEVAWRRAGSPSATVAIGADGARLVAYVVVRAGDPHFATAAATNPFDNEHADTMRAGVQLYVRVANDSGAWVLVPESAGDHVRVRTLPGWGDLQSPIARWRRNADNYEMRVELSLPSARSGDLPLSVDVIVNETTRTRERRRGQLVMSGASGEFVYLRGDRHDADRLIPFLIVS